MAEMVPYINLVGMRLEKFKQSRPTLWNARCPICGDSSKRKGLARFYIHPDIDKTKYMASCRNCNYADSFVGFTKEYHADIYNDIIFDLFKNGGASKKYTYTKPIAKIEEVIQPVHVECSLFPSIDLLSDDHPIVKYLISRKIPKFQWSRLSYCKNFKDDVCNQLETYKDSEMPSDARLLIPFYNGSGALTHLQARALDNSSLRYITLKIIDTNKVFGLDKLKPNTPKYVVEGPIDSLFIPNCVATADSNLLSYQDGDIYIPDNQYRNQEIAKSIDEIIESGKAVVIFPSTFTYKDINDAIVAGVSYKELYGTIQQNTVSGLSAKLKWTAANKHRVSYSSSHNRF